MTQRFEGCNCFVAVHVPTVQDVILQLCRRRLAFVALQTLECYTHECCACCLCKIDVWDDMKTALMGKEEINVVLS